MPRLFLAFLLLLAGLNTSATAAPADGIPPRPVPFTFVTDKANLLPAADAKRLENGLHKYADKTGTQIVVVTVPSLNGTDVADYGRQLGTAWGVGQRGKNNGLVVLLSAQDHKLTIQPGSGLRSVITSDVIARVISQDMTPSFKQGNYAAGLRAGLNTLMVTANPDSDPRKQQATTATAAAATTTDQTTPNTNLADDATTTTTTTDAAQTPVEPASSGIGIGTLLIGALVIGGVLWLLLRIFRRNSAASNGAGAPNFYPNQPGQPTQGNAPNFYPNQPGYGAPNQSSGSGIGGILATGAAAAAGAYIGNRMSSDHESGNSSQNFGSNNNAGLGAGAAGAGTGSDYFANRDHSATSPSSSPDYFSDDKSSNSSSSDYFSSNDDSSSSTSYDDNSSSDTGGGGFDSSDSNSGSW